MQQCVICNSNPEILWPKRWQCWKENGKFSESLCKLLGLPKYYESDLQKCAYCSGCQKKVYNIYLIVRKWDKLQEDITKLKKELQGNFHDALEKCMQAGNGNGKAGDEGASSSSLLDKKTVEEDGAEEGKVNSLRRKILKRLSRSHFPTLTNDWDCSCCCDDSKTSDSTKNNRKYCNEKCCNEWNQSQHQDQDGTKHSFQSGSESGSDYSSGGEDEDHDHCNCNLCCSSPGDKNKKESYPAEKYCDDCPICKEEEEERKNKKCVGGSGGVGEKGDTSTKKKDLNLKGILGGEKKLKSKSPSPPPLPPPATKPKLPSTLGGKKSTSTSALQRAKKVKKDKESDLKSEVICMPTDNCMSGDGDESNASSGNNGILSIQKNSKSKDPGGKKKDVSISNMLMNGGKFFSDLKSSTTPASKGKSRFKLHEDILINYTEKRFRCHKSNCIVSFATPEELDIHTKRHHEGIKCPFVCKDCGKAFQKRRDLETHALKHAGKFAFTCQICGRGFGTKANFDMHMKTKHSEKARKFKCSFCDKAFLCESKLKTHLTIHTKEYPFSCMICGKGFSAKTFLNIHMNKHSNPSPYKCDLCPKTFTSPRNLRIHQYTHDQTHPFRCSECGAGQPSETTLKQHMLKHEEEKSHVCHVCNSKFQFPSSLKKHLKIHDGDMRFVCEFCNKNFIDKYKLTRHVRTHSGEKPYECAICKKRFAAKDYLNTHMKKHNHNNNNRGSKRVSDSIPSSTISNASDESFNSFTYSTNSSQTSQSLSQSHLNPATEIPPVPVSSSSSIYIPPPQAPPAPASSIPTMVSLPEDDHPTQVDELTATIQLENLSSEQLLMMDQDNDDVVESSQYDSQNATSSDDVAHLMDFTPNSLLTPIFQTTEQLEMMNGDFCELSFQNL